MKKYITTIILLAFFGFLSGQDSYVFHTDKPYYVTGDIVWYSVKLPSSFKGREIAINNYVADEMGNVKKQFFANNESSQIISGHFQVPYSWESNMYQIAIAAQDLSSGNEKILSSVEIPIYNDINGSQIELSDNVLTSSGLSGQISVSINKEVFQPREEVQIKLNRSGLKNISIAVVDNKFFTEEQIGAQLHDIPSQMDESSVNWNAQPYITGQLSTESGDPMRLNVLGAYDMKSRDMLYSKSSATGGFKLSLSPFKGQKLLHFNPYLFDEFDELEVNTVENIGIKASKSIAIDSSIVDYITASQMRKKIYQQYGKIENELMTEEIRIVKKELKPNRVYKISDYQNFDNVAAFFNEILSTELSFVRNEDGKFIGRMYNPKNRKNSNRKESSYFEKEPIFIIDDKITKDADKIGRLPLDNIETVGLYYKQDDIKRDFRTFGGSAYVIVTTSYPNLLLEDDEERDIIAINGYQAKTAPPNINANSALTEEPLYRSMLYWNSNVEGINDQVSISFNNSDDVSNYVVLVSATDSNGNIVKGVKKYQVRYSN